MPPTLVDDAGAAPRDPTYVTATVAGHMFGVPIERVHDVFNVGRITPIPLTPPEVAGLSNLRGRVVTMLDLRARLGGTAGRGTMALGIEAGPESFGLFVDAVGEIMKLPAASAAETPVHLDSRWAELARGVHQLAEGILVVLDVDAVLLSIRRAITRDPVPLRSLP